MIRFITVIVLVIIFLIVTIPVLFVEWIIGHFNPAVKNRSSLSIVQWAFRVCLKVSGVKLTVKGQENIPKDRSVLYIGNHRSYFDIIICYTLMPGITGFISKKEINKVPLLNLWMRNLKCLFMDRDDIKQSLKVITTAIDYVKSGISIFIFPEGTRVKEKDTFLPFKGGSFKIATRSGCDVIPVSINNSSAIFEDQFPKIRKGHVIVEFGKPIVIKDMSREELKELPDLARQKVMAMYDINKELI